MSALTATTPQSNAAAVTGSGTGKSNSNSGNGVASLNGRRCFRCNGEHLVRNFPQPAPAGGGTNGGNNSSGGVGAGRLRTPLAAWKYVKPDDVTVPRVDAQGKIWKFCSKCKCRATNKVGYYQLSHYEADHVENYR